MAKKKIEFCKLAKDFSLGRAFGWLLATLVFVLLPMGQIWGAVPFSCGLQTLKGASGVIGMKHSYALSGVCSESWVYSKETGVVSGTSKNAGYTMQVLGDAKWDRITGEARENLKISGDVSGKRMTTGICTQDPFLKDPPDGLGSCTGVKSVIEISSGQLWESLTAHKFWFSRTVTLSVAQALSAQDAEKPPPPPPPPLLPKQACLLIRLLNGLRHPG